MGRKIKKLIQVNRSTYKVSFSTCRGKRKFTRVSSNLRHQKPKSNGVANFVTNTQQNDVPQVAETQDERCYVFRKTKEMEAWEKAREPFLNASVEKYAPYGSTCSLCGQDGSIFRCRDCLPHPLCYDCVLSAHVLTPLHIIEKWRREPGVYWPFDIPAMRKLTVPEAIPTSIRTEKSMILIDEKGRTHYNCKIIYANHNDQSLGKALIKLGFWPLTPCSPNKAISINLLNVSHSLMLECQTSCQGFVSAMERANPSHPQSPSKLNSIGNGECLPEFRLFAQAMERGPISLLDHLQHWQTSCPSCPKGSARGEMFLSMDGNFGLVHKANGGQRESTSNLSTMLFLDQKNVDSFVESYFQDTKDNTEVCSQFQAAEAVRSKNRAANLNVTGVFGASCRHEIPQVFMDVRHGERLAYPVTVLQKVKERCGDTVSIKVLYDIACTLQSHLKKRNRQALLQNIQLAIPVFHAYGHKGECQVTMNPRRMAGFGLVDGEQMERLWAYLRLFAKITKEQTSGHRKELLTMALLNFTQKKIDALDQTLLNRWEKAESGYKTAEECLSQEKAKLPDSQSVPSENMAEFISDLKEEEAAHLKQRNQRAKVTDLPWKQAYAKELLCFHTLQSQLRAGLISSNDTETIFRTNRQINQSAKKLRSFEKKHKIKRWDPQDEQYIEQLGKVEDTRRRVLLQKLLGLSVEKAFFLELRKKYSDGQAVAQRLANQLRLISKSIRSNIASYNVGSHHTHVSCYPSEINYEDINIDSDIFDILDCEGTRGQVPFSLQRKILDQWEFSIRCQEEKGMVCEDMRYAYLHFLDLHDVLVLVLDGLHGSNLYEVGLRSLAIVEVFKIENRLKRMYETFQKYTGIPPPPKEYVPHIKDAGPLDDVAIPSEEETAEQPEVNIDDTEMAHLDLYEDADLEIILGQNGGDENISQA